MCRNWQYIQHQDPVRFHVESNDPDDPFTQPCLMDHPPSLVDWELAASDNIKYRAAALVSATALPSEDDEDPFGDQQTSGQMYELLRGFAKLGYTVTHSDPKLYQWQLDFKGVPWNERSKPRKLHVCNAHTTFINNGEITDRCACGAIKNGVTKNKWHGKNTRK